jgi:hypothetical protein
MKCKTNQKIQKMALLKACTMNILTWVIVCIGIFTLISSLSIAKDDGLSKSFDNPKTVNIKQGSTQLGKVQLVYNTDNCLSECWTIWNVTIGDNTKTFLNDLSFKDSKGSSKSMSYKIEYAESFKEVAYDDTERVCNTEKIEANKTTRNAEVCEIKVVGKKTEYIPQWKTISTDKMPKGSYYIKVTGYKNRNENIDWQPTFYGVKVTEWAWWYGVQPVGYWKFNQSTGDATDYGWGGHDGILVNTELAQNYSYGKLGNASIYTRGGGQAASTTDGYQQIGNYDNLGNNSFTLAIWVNASNDYTWGAGSSKPIIGKGLNPAVAGWLLQWKAGAPTEGKIRFDCTGVCGAPIYTTNTFDDSKWHRVVITRDNTTSVDSFKIYVDNVLEQTYSMNKNVNLTTDDSQFRIGWDNNNGFSGHREGIDDVQLYWNVWTDLDVALDYNSGTGLEADSENITQFSEMSQTYNATTYDTAYEGFRINFLTLGVISATAFLDYNNTLYPSTVTCASKNCTAVTNINVPPIYSPTVNNSFHWIITAYNGTSSYTTNSSKHNQTVTQLTVGDCTTGVIALNFTAYDEQNRTRINSFDFEGNFQYYSGGGIVQKEVNISNSTANEIHICINQNVTFYLDGIIAYSVPALGNQYVTRNWFYQRYPINGTMQNVNLYSLVTASSTSFILQVQSAYLLPAQNVLVEAQRCYPGTNTIETVFKSRTDSNGLTVGNLEAETALYQFLITNQSNTLLAVTPCSKIVPQTTPYTLLFQLGSGYQSPFTNINNVTGITSNLYYNYTNNILSWTYTDTSGQFTNAELVVKALNYSGNVQPTICSGTNNLSSGIINCNVSTAGSYYAQVYVHRSTQTLIDQITFTVSTFASTVGYYGAFLGFFLILVCCFAFKFNEIAGIWLVIAACLFCNIVGLIAFGNVFITAILCLGVVITAILER